MRSVPLGDQELEILRFITDRAPVTVRDVTTHFGEPHNLARTTIATVMERLSKKGYLVRDKGSDGPYYYKPRQSQEVVLKNLVRAFVEKTLGGAIAPFVAYLDETSELTDEEAAQLRRLVEKLPSKKNKT